MKEEIYNQSHRRLNILTGELIQVSPHRNKRPWQGQTEKVSEIKRAEYDAQCYLCPGNDRAGGAKNPPYESTFSFVNDFGAIQEAIKIDFLEDGLLKAKSERGICKVICFSPRHDQTLPEMELRQIESVIKLWVDECNQLGTKDFINHVQIFENKGSVMGCSNPHPHGQIWAQETIPNEVKKKCDRQLDYYQQKGDGLLTKYLSQELKLKKRILYENNDMVVLVPYWATWPFEAMILPKKNCRTLQHYR